jgi:PKD repeat protein
LNVAFTDSSTGSVTSYAWTFGDGGTSTQQNPSYTYTTAGTFSVALTVELAA